MQCSFSFPRFIYDFECDVEALPVRLCVLAKPLKDCPSDLQPLPTIVGAPRSTYQSLSMNILAV